MGKHNEFGKYGEQMAVEYLLANGYHICARNYRYQKAEIDIIAKKQNIIAVVEVKARTTGFLGDLSDIISKNKIGLLVRAADEYVQANGLSEEVRFDVIMVVKMKARIKIDHLENAFYHF